MNWTQIKAYWNQSIDNVRDFWDWFTGDHLDALEASQFSEPRKAYVIITEDVKKQLSSEQKLHRANNRN
jgi:hypothetical protein